MEFLFRYLFVYFIILVISYTTFNIYIKNLKLRIYTQLTHAWNSWMYNYLMRYHMTCIGSRLKQEKSNRK